MRVVPRNNIKRTLFRPGIQRRILRAIFAFLGVCSVPHLTTFYAKGVYETMKMMTGVMPKETMEISEILASDLYGQTISVNGAVHTVRDMGEVAFVVLRKREGLLQCVYEEGVTAIDLKELKEGAAIEVSGVLNKEDRAPGGFEIRMKEVKILSEPTEKPAASNCEMEDEYFPGKPN